MSTDPSFDQDHPTPDNDLAMLRSAFDELLVGVVVHARDTRILLSNPEAQTILGSSADQMVGKTTWDPGWCFLREDGSRLPIEDHPVNRVIATGERIVGRITGIRKPGLDEVTWVSVSAMPVRDSAGEIDRVVVNFVDVTESLESEAALRESEEKFRALFEKSPMGVAYHQMIYDDEGRPVDYFFLDANENYRELTGVDPRGKLVTEAFAGIGGDTAAWIGTFARAARDGETIRFQEHLELSDRWYDVVGFQSTPDHFVAAFIEITEQRRLEEQLRRSQKMEAVGQLAGGIAHDFNNILQAIHGYGELALDDLPDGAPSRGMLEEVVKASDRAQTLVGQLLAFSRQQVLEMRDIDLNDAIVELLKMLGRVIGEHVTLDFLPGRDLGVVRADPGRIGQILTNLCVNARDAMPAGGTIAIETENVRIDEAYCRTHSWASPGRWVLLSVTDGGCGMDQETLERVFDPFFTTKDVGKGTGLGLATVYGLVQQHSGMVQVYSEPGKGTTFKIYLRQVERPAVAVGSKITGVVPRGRETILLAEDDDAVRDLTRDILERSGYSVLTATDGEDAIRVFDQHVGAIDLVILDVVMPRLGGRAVLDHVRGRRPEVGVLFSSGYSLNAIHTNFILDDGFELIQKPFHRDDLLRKVREVLDEG